MDWPHEEMSGAIKRADAALYAGKAVIATSLPIYNAVRGFRNKP